MLLSDGAAAHVDSFVASATSAGVVGIIGIDGHGAQGGMACGATEGASRRKVAVM